LNEIGERLRSARELAGISLDEVSEDLNIKVPILDNMEQGNIGCFKDIFLLKEYIHNYSKYLGLSPDDMVNEFNEYLFEYTSKIPVTEIEKKIQEKQKLEDTQEIRIASPYTDDKRKYKSKNYIILYILVVILVALAIFWAVKMITIDNKVATMISWVE
jgi:cytoskeletal protein RodZ